jgi:FKBP-type peptidyl-prolyl cis-trans isomerase FklB
MHKTHFMLVASLLLGLALPGVSLAQSSPAPATPSKTAATPSQQSPAKKPAASSTAKKPSVAMSLKTGRDKASYSLGVNVGRSFHRSSLEPKDVNSAAFLQGVRDALADKKLLLTDQEMQAALASLQTELRKEVEAKDALLAAPNRKKGVAFLAENKSKDGVVTLPDGLQYKILKAGDGPKPTAADVVNCKYRGTLIDGTEFDGTDKRGDQPVKFPVNGVIKGWTEALQLMPVGSKWQLYIPADLAYGDQSRGPLIQPGSTLIFEIELVSIESKPVPAAK